MSRRKTDYEETDAERIPLRNIRRKIAVHMENGRDRFEYRNKCPECDEKPAAKHEKYWDAKKEIVKNSRCHSAHCGVKKQVPAVRKTNYDFDRIVENATVEYDFNKNKRKSILDSLGLEKKPKSFCQNAKPKIQKKKERRDENDIYGEHIAMQLRKLKNPKTVALARLKIDQVIFSSSIGDRAWTNKHLNKIVQKRRSSKIRDSQNTEKAE